MMRVQPTLFDPELLVGRYSMWFRRGPRCRWRLLGTADAEMVLMNLVAGSGDYYSRETSRGDPNDEVKTNG